MRVLLVKLSSLGDVVHTLPVVQDILAALPGAQIDWVVEKAFAPLLLQLTGVQRVIPCELRRWRKSIWAATTRREWRAFKADLQANSYDAVIDLQGLTKSALVMRLAKLTDNGQRYAMANQTDGSGYESPTRWAADVAIAIAPRIHAVARGRWLAAKALGYANQQELRLPNYGLNRPLDESIRAREAPEKIAFIHGSSRQDKTWALHNWVALGQRLAALGYQPALVHGSAAELVTSRAIAAQLSDFGIACDVWPLLPLDELTKQLGACHGAIGVDSGVSHMAVALGLPHVQIYNFDTAWRTGPLGARHQVSVFDKDSPTVDAVWQAWLQCTGDHPSTVT